MMGDNEKHIEADSKKPLIRNLRDARKYMKLTQEELGYLLGVTGVYISQIESNDRPLNDEIAEKIIMLIHDLTKDEDEEPLTPNKGGFSHYVFQVKWYHTASFYPQDKQTRLIRNAYKLKHLEFEINSILEGEDLGEEFYMYGLEEIDREIQDEPNIYVKMKLHKKTLFQRLNKLRASNALKNKRPVLRKRRKRKV